MSIWVCNTMIHVQYLKIMISLRMSKAIHDRHTFTLLNSIYGIATLILPRKRMKNDYFDCMSKNVHGKLAQLKRFYNIRNVNRFGSSACADPEGGQKSGPPP